MDRNTLMMLGASLILLPVAAAGQAASDGRGFNPRISLVLQGTYADFSSAAEPEVPGVLLGPETELRPAGPSLAESELVLESNVDHWFHGWASVALENEDGETVVALEEAYVDTLALPLGLALKFGRFFSGIGYHNQRHAHTWDFVDAPLVYRALLANVYQDDGLQLRWVAPTDLYLEVGAEVLRGDGFPGGGDLRRGARNYSAFSHLGGDLGADHAWRVGLSHLSADANGRRTGEDVETAFSGDSDLRILDVVWKWSPGGNPARQNAVLNAEFFWREEDGEVVLDPDGDGAGPVVSAYEGRQRGFYVQGAWQFLPHWRVGARLDRLEPDNRVGNNPGGAFGGLARDEVAQRWSAMADYSASEFSRLRVQFNRDETRPGGRFDHQFFVQYIVSIGSHPAHAF